MSNDLERKTLLTAALSQLTEGVIITDNAGAILYVNAAAERLHGVAKFGVTPEGYSDTFHLFREDGSPYPFEELPLSRAVRDGVTVLEERWLIRRPDGTEVVAEGSATPVMSADGQKIGAVLTLRDRTLAIADERALQSALEVQKMLLSEVNHRVANNLSLLVSLLNYQARRSKSNETRELLSQTQSRIRVMSTVHAALYRVEGEGKVALAGYLETMLDKITATLTDSIEVRVVNDTTQDRVLPVGDVIPLALAINELATNSLKYAFKDVTEPTITFSLNTDDAGKTVLVYRDNGGGLPDGFTLKDSDGLGMTILQTLGTQLNAKIDYYNDKGAVFEISF
ncbi:sensor histidine kinase [Pontivivens insulae]|uniref:histidine kinase n=1 Tax=Pontivivens insulae TaxID=1639689 RepID=A0A2R8ABF9_9RHOB|nr:histidine kinase dimerization/phosphoacceptor domain -containing protein [Pontivivens insulae]RED13333.1 PAS domain S-box-containing protein [Pontivivens insulae]SPF29425.1 putative sensor histidine kinase pdtaS [Pontivivens insulae]